MVARRCRCCRPWYQGRGLGELPELRTHDRSRINLAKAAELEASGGAGGRQASSGSIQSGRPPGSSSGAGDLLRRVLGRAGAGFSVSSRRRGLRTVLLPLSASVLTRTVERHSR